MGHVLEVRVRLFAIASAILALALPGSAQVQEPAAAAASASTGPADAPYVLTVYSDFACEPCGHLAAVLKGLVAARPQAVRIEFKHAPAAVSRGQDAHLAAAAAARQGRFWDMHNVLFANQDRLAAADAMGMAEQIGLDMAQFRAALQADDLAAAVDADGAAAERLDLTARPCVLINGTPFTALHTLENLTGATGG